MQVSPCIITCLNERPRVSQIILRCAERLLLPVMAGVSCSADMALILGDCQTPVLSDNIPGQKWNAALYLALNTGYFTHFLIMGDDDSLSLTGLSFLIGHAQLGFDYVGFKSNAYYDLAIGKAMRHDYKYRCDKLIGAGRMVSRGAIERVAFTQKIRLNRDCIWGIKHAEVDVTPAVASYLEAYNYARIASDPIYTGLWNPKLKSGLDHDSELRLVMNGIIPKAVDDGRIHITDFKSPVTNQSIWPYSILEGSMKLGCKAISKEDATWFMSAEEKEYIESFR